jgi:hypothetical protein
METSTKSTDKVQQSFLEVEAEILAEYVSQEERLASLALEEGTYNLIRMAKTGASYDELRSAFLETATAAGLTGAGRRAR